MSGPLAPVPTVADHFQLGKSQAELDFVNVPVNGDLPLFIDPFAVSLRLDRWSQDCTHLLRYFFQQVIDRIRGGDQAGARRLLRYLGEPNETRLGLSRGRPQGAGIGTFQADQLYTALSASAAVQQGFLRHLEEAELMIPGIGRDKISDLTTNVIRKALADYTIHQCRLLDVPTKQVALAPFFSAEHNRWVNEYLTLPIADGRPLLLVPKAIVRYDLAYDHRDYYNQFVVDFLRAEELNAGSSLVSVLRNGNHVVYKKDVESKFPLTKEFLYEFSRHHPEVLQEYRESLEEEARTVESIVEESDERVLAGMLEKALAAIPAGGEHASQYHRLMVGIVEFLLFPHLLYPVKEEEIHQGRKRIDILMENGAAPGTTLHSLHDIKKLPCAFVPIECKNYTTEVANPELDQLAGRFSPNRGKFGILCCRTFEDRNAFIERCRDTLRDDRGLIVPLDDLTVRELLAHVADGNRDEVDVHLGRLIKEVWLA